MAFDLELPRPGYGAAAAIVDQQLIRGLRVIHCHKCKRELGPDNGSWWHCGLCNTTTGRDGKKYGWPTATSADSGQAYERKVAEAWAKAKQSEATTKATNPKDAIASDKAPLHLVPASFKAYTALALAEGMMKYGSWNWRAAGVRASVYVSALQRHVDKWFNGEECDPKTGVPHLANAAACLAVLIDSLTQDNMTDDRPPVQLPLPGLLDDTVPAKVAGLRQVFGHHDPKHYTIADGKDAA